MGPSRTSSQVSGPGVPWQPLGPAGRPLGTGGCRDCHTVGLEDQSHLQHLPIPHGTGHGTAAKHSLPCLIALPPLLLLPSLSSSSSLLASLWVALLSSEVCPFHCPDGQTLLSPLLRRQLHRGESSVGKEGLAGAARLCHPPGFSAHHHLGLCDNAQPSSAPG